MKHLCSGYSEILILYCTEIVDIFAVVIPADKMYLCGLDSANILLSLICVRE